MDEKEIKVKLAIDEDFFNDFTKKMNESIGGIKGGNKSLAKVQESSLKVEMDKVKLAKETYKLELLKKKESERILKLEEKKSKALEKQNKDIGFISKALKSMGFQGSARGEVIRGGFRQLGVNVINGVGDAIGNLSGGFLSGSGALAGAGMGAAIGSVVPVLGNIIGAGIGAVIGGIIAPSLNKLTESFGERMSQIRELMLKKFPEGDVATQLEVSGNVKNYQEQKNQLLLASSYKMTEKEAGQFVSTLSSSGFDTVGFYKQALKLSKNKESEFYGKSATEIMDLIITAIGSKQYSKEERVANFNRIQNMEGVKDLFSSVTDVNLLEKMIRKGNLESSLSYYNKLGINEKKVASAVDYMSEDDITTNLDNRKLATDFVIKENKKIVDYENTLNAVKYETIKSTDLMTSTTKSLNDALKTYNYIMEESTLVTNKKMKAEQEATIQKQIETQGRLDPLGAGMNKLGNFVRSIFD
jgi:hypothetical protein